MFRVLILALLITAVKCGVFTITNEVKDQCNLSKKLIDEIASHQENVNRIIDAVVHGQFKGNTYKELATFVDKFGARVSGTKNLENSIDYVLGKLNESKLDNVHGEEVPVPHWVRGQESAKLLEPRKANIPVLGLGTSVPTPEEGITAEVLVVTNFDQLNSSASGKIVVFNNEYISYGVSVAYRSQGASKAAEHGAVAALIRSVTPFSMRTLHTGQQSYASKVKKIPAASITVEDAKMFQRLQDNGEKIVLELKMSSVTNPMATSRNVVAEIKGSLKPEKVVIVSGHIDSWDVGVGAMDDGGGAFISWNALVVLRKLGLRAKRTIRSVLWTAEEPGLWGAVGYNATHYNETDNFNFLMESDIGTFTPRGLSYTAGTTGGCIIKEILKLTSSINTTEAVHESATGSDITIWTGNGIPGASLLNKNERYFWYHHTEADTMDVENPDDLDKATALWTAAAFVIADLSIDFPRDGIDISKSKYLLSTVKDSVEANRKINSRN